MRVLVACEFSGRVREAFRLNGHDAWSCDFLPSLDNSPFHITGDVSPVLSQPWDLVVAHPPCTYLARAGARWWKGREREQAAAVAFVMACAAANAPRVAVENPIGALSRLWRKPDQLVQPWMFGDEACKETCFWLKGLPLLTPTNIVSRGNQVTFSSGRRMPSWYNLPPGPNRARLRSLTFPGMARAIADQWGPRE